MKDIIIKLFDLEESKIHDIEIINVNEEVFALVTLRKNPTPCPHCGKFADRTHDYRRRTINHAILNDLNFTLVYNRRRYFCLSCKKAFPETNPFVVPGRRISKFTIMRVMKLLSDPRVTFSMAAAATDTSVTTVQRIFDQHAGIKVRTFPTILCIDEVYAIKYKQRIYACVLADFNTNQIYDLLPTRKKYDLAKYFSAIPRETRNQVKYVSMDMWDTYRDVAKTYFRNAKICVDSFHVIKLVNYAFTKVRIRIMNSFPKNSDEYYLLKKYSWIIIKQYRKIDYSRRIKVNRNTSYFWYQNVDPRDLISALLSIDPELEIAYMLKEEYMEMNATCTVKTISTRIERYIQDLFLYNIPEFRPIAKTLSKWKEEIINSFNKVDGRRISNGPVESINSRIKLIKYSAAGYKNFDRFRRRVLYSLNESSCIKI